MRSKRTSYCSMLTVVLLLMLVSSSSVSAAEVDIHGYGYQGYLLSNKNNYLDAQEGSWNFNEFALLFSAKAEDRTTIWIQLSAESEPGEESKAGIDWAFVDYRLVNELFARAGQIRFPVGIYNEIRDNKMLHLSMLEPSMYRDTIDVVFEAFRGASLYYNGVMAVDLFGGAPVMEEEEGVEFEVKNLGGGRIIYNTPLKGLRLMGSYAAFSEEQFDAATGLPLFPEGHEKLLMGSIDFVKGGADLQAEYARKEGIDEDLLSYYVQAGYTFGEKFTPFVRYDYIESKENGCSSSDPSCYQKDISAGIRYNVNSYFAIKAEEHWMDGFLLPLETGEVNPADAEKKWNMFVAGINFMF